MTHDLTCGCADRLTVYGVDTSLVLMCDSSQTFCGTVKRTVLLDDIKDIEDEEDLQDHLEIHFQKPSNCGGEIENIKYVSGGNDLQAYFCEDKVEEED